MSPERYVLDTSALLALIEDEEGAERVSDVIETGEAIIPWPVLLELTYITRRERGNTEAEVRYALVRELPVLIIWDITERVVFTAARLKAENRISLADAMVASYVHTQQAILLHKDPEFEALEGVLQLQSLPYKA